MPQIFKYENEEEWLALRAHDVTSTEVACLFGESPYSTDFELYHRKHSGTSVAFESNDRVVWGKRYEAPTAEGLAQDNGWNISPLKVYMRHSMCAGMGSSFDYEIIKHGRKGILEIKTVDFSEYKKKWLSADDEIEAPVHIELQLQHQLEVAASGDNQNHDYDFGIIAAMIGGNKPVVVERERDRDIGKLMCGKVTDFWHRVKNNIEPMPDFTKDGDIIKLLYADASGDEIDLSANNRFAALVGEYQELQAAASSAKKAQDAAKTEMASIMKTASLAKCGDMFVTRKTVNRGAYSVEASSYVLMGIKQEKGEKK